MSMYKTKQQLQAELQELLLVREAVTAKATAKAAAYLLKHQELKKPQ